MGYRSLLVAVLASSAACGTTTDPTLELAREAGSELSIVLNKTSYSWSEISSGGDGITATVTNNGSEPVYARMGDAFNAADEQEMIFAALGSDGAVQLQSGASWTSHPTAILFEGVKTIVLKPGVSYKLHAMLQAPQVAGTARIRIVWWTDPNDVGGDGAQESTSAAFEIR